MGYLWRSSPFFMSIRSWLGDVALTGFDIHSKATTAGKVEKVRQIIKGDELINEVDIVAGLLPGVPFALQGTVVTSADIEKVSPETWNLKVKTTNVRSNDIDIPISMGVGDIYSSIIGSVPISVVKTFYIDDEMRIFRDSDDNFFVFVRA